MSPGVSLENSWILDASATMAKAKVVRTRRTSNGLESISEMGKVWFIGIGWNAKRKMKKWPFKLPFFATLPFLVEEEEEVDMGEKGGKVVGYFLFGMKKGRV